VSEINAFEESDRAARARLEEEFARQIARGLELAGEVERLEAEVERLRAALERHHENDFIEAKIERLTAALEEIARHYAGNGEGVYMQKVARAALAKEEVTAEDNSPR